MSLFKRFTACLLTLCLVLALSACGTEEQTASESESTEPVSAEEEKEHVLSFSAGLFSGSYSPFYAETEADRVLADLTSLPLLTRDEQGQIVWNAAEQDLGPADILVEKNEEDGTVKVTVSLREDLTFSDGEPVTAKDLLFTYYVLLDPAYNGPLSVKNCPISGLWEYLSNSDDAEGISLEETLDEVLEAGDDYTFEESEEDSEESSEEDSGEDTGDTASFTEEEYETLTRLQKECWLEELRRLENYCVDNYSDCLSDLTSENADLREEGWRVALAAYVWGFGTLENGTMTFPETGKTYSVSDGVLPTREELYDEVYALYDGDAEAYWETEGVSGTDIAGTALTLAALELSDGEEEDLAVEGITLADDYTLEITMEYSTPAILETLCDIWIAPLHWYGNQDEFDPENNAFGHSYGNLGSVDARNGNPLGAGVYVLAERNNGVLTLTANENYYAGAPAAGTLQMLELAENQWADAMESGLLDFYRTDSDVDETLTVYETEGSELTYLGMNAENVCLYDSSASAESTAFRQGLATLFAACADKAVAEAGLNRALSPVSSSLTPEDFSMYTFGTEWQDLYTEDMTPDEKISIAAETCLAFMEQAGLTEDSETVELSALLLEGDTLGEQILALASEKLPSFVTVTVSYAESLSDWEKTVSSGETDIWMGTRILSDLPDLYDVFHSDSLPDRSGSGLNWFRLRDEDLNTKLSTLHSDYPGEEDEETFAECLELISGWGVVVPVSVSSEKTVCSAAVSFPGLTDVASAGWTALCSAAAAE